MALLLTCVVTDYHSNMTNHSCDGMTTLPSNYVSKPPLGAEQLQQGIVGVAYMCCNIQPITAGSQGARGSFTSQYVANHLQDLIASPSGTYVIFVNQTNIIDDQFSPWTGLRWKYRTIIHIV